MFLVYFIFANIDTNMMNALPIRQKEPFKATIMSDLR